MVHQFYQTRVIDEFVLRGNAATLKCLVPSFVADFVQIVGWISDDGKSYVAAQSDSYGNTRSSARCRPRGTSLGCRR